jgi:hypothetical protein
MRIIVRMRMGDRTAFVSPMAVDMHISGMLIDTAEDGHFRRRRGHINIAATRADISDATSEYCEKSHA